MYLLKVAVALIALSLSASIATAADFSKVIANEDNKPLCTLQIKDGEECPSEKLATLGRIVKSSLYATFPDEQNLSGEDKYKRAELAMALSGKDIKLKAEDIALMKKLVAKLYSPLVVYQVWRELDPQ